MENHSNFIKTIMIQDLESKKHDEIITRFPPEPNGYLHIGHARAVINNFELAKNFGGKTNLRFDDTNPGKEDVEYVNAIIEDIKWLGYEPNKVLYASDYFEEMYHRAILLIKKGLAYVDDLSAEEISKTRGNLTTPGTESPFRNRSVSENIELFENMNKGMYKEGEKVLRAKIDMASPNMNMRDPVIYRISYAEHHNTGKRWCIYPMYDYAHPLEDAIEGITHSLCSLEFEDHRPLYDWVVRETEMPLIPRQIEFGRLNIENTVMSKRYLKQLVDEKHVIGWDDPRMPTLSGLRRRGYTPEAIRNFILGTGLSRINTTVNTDMLESFLRDDLANNSSKLMGVIDPLKVTVINYDEDKVEAFTVPFDPNKPELGERTVYFSKHLYIEQDDFVEVKPNKHWKRLAKDVEVRLFHTYFIKCVDVIKDETGKVVELLVTYDPETKSGSGFSERKPNGTIHFVSAHQSIKTQFNLFGPLVFDGEAPFIERLNKDSWIKKEGFIEAAFSKDIPTKSFQLIRMGYFNFDKVSTKENMVLNRIVELKSSFQK
ncbi:glutamine--tRNA ligase/YqeY domain fusion protein [Paracholeplasma morum]|uniref:glutamine--tRNA ligase/YqeY domain fusion protein n=1 Tax=Paracholeplasma morum TaxID=264637 RepID=UPI00195E57FC|nr:glutamine--tRNA ligase/YqeY domain fusion protein [Paracholeplasma morum]